MAPSWWADTTLLSFDFTIWNIQNWKCLQDFQTFFSTTARLQLTSDEKSMSRDAQNNIIFMTMGLLPDT